MLVVVAAIWSRRQEFSRQAFAPAKTPESSEPSLREPDAERLPDRVDATSSAKAIPDQEFKDWIRREASQLDAIGIDTADRERKIRRALSTLTAGQSRQLLQTAKDPKAPSREKILSTYLLVESGAQGQRELAELIKSPMDKAVVTPHSEAEYKGVRDKSLRIMAIDGLYARARSDREAHEHLARVTSQIEDPFVRSYAEDKLRQLNAVR